jgi:hypothetical protein
MKFNVLDHVKENGECLEWVGSYTPQGYGRTSRKWGKQHLAHRLSYIQNVGPIPDGRCICHKCDNPACVRPEHLFVGTHKDNIVDMVKKGRHFSPQKNVLFCKRGHEFNDTNTVMVRTTGKRRCRKCRNQLARNWRKKNPDSASSSWSTRKEMQNKKIIHV